MRKLLVALLMVPSMAWAEFFSGNQLLAKITSSEYMDKAQAIGYIQGVYDAGLHIRHCAPDNAGINAGQVQDIVRNYLERNPATRNYAADVLIIDALRKVWPCANKGKGA
jgi:hypothetical protein